MNSNITRGEAMTNPEPAEVKRLCLDEVLGLTEESLTFCENKLTKILFQLTGNAPELTDERKPESLLEFAGIIMMKAGRCGKLADDIARILWNC